MAVELVERITNAQVLERINKAAELVDRINATAEVGGRLTAPAEVAQRFTPAEIEERIIAATKTICRLSLAASNDHTSGVSSMASTTQPSTSPKKLEDLQREIVRERQIREEVNRNLSRRSATVMAFVVEAANMANSASTATRATCASTATFFQNKDSPCEDEEEPCSELNSSFCEEHNVTVIENNESRCFGQSPKGSAVKSPKSAEKNGKGDEEQVYSEEEEKISRGDEEEGESSGDEETTIVASSTLSQVSASLMSQPNSASTSTVALSTSSSSKSLTH